MNSSAYRKVDPHGDPIPDNKGKLKILPQIAIDQLNIGYQGKIAAVKDSDSNLLKYLDKIGARPGTKIKILGKEDYDGSMEILIADHRIFISKEVSQNILVIE
ncbi:MAG: FeoA family protein [Cytophagales bacterium]|nr:FeoA family protein [Cytophagales bacterium]